MQFNNLREKMFALCREWEDSGKKREDFCRAHDISLARFGYWRTQYLSECRPAAEKTSGDDFVPLTAGFSSEMEIQYPNGVMLKVPKHISLSDLKALICLM